MKVKVDLLLSAFLSLLPSLFSTQSLNIYVLSTGLGAREQEMSKIQSLIKGFRI